MRFPTLDRSAQLSALRVQRILVEELIDGFRVAERGGVVEIAKLQMTGFAYIRS